MVLFRPNQILAVGGLPLSLVDETGARRVVEAVESRLVTPMGLRSLAPARPATLPDTKAMAPNATPATTRARCGRG